MKTVTSRLSIPQLLVPSVCHQGAYSTCVSETLCQFHGFQVYFRIFWNHTESDDDKKLLGAFIE